MSTGRKIFATAQIVNGKIVIDLGDTANYMTVKGDCSPVDDWDYEVPGQMELSDFIEMPKGGNDDD